MNLSKWGGANSNFRNFEFVPSRVFSKATQLAWASWPCLGELGDNLLPFFSYKKAKWGCSKDPWFPWLCISAILGEKNCFREENPSRGVYVTLPRRFREQIREGFPSCFTVLHPDFLVLRSSTSKFSNPRLSIHFLFFNFLPIFIAYFLYLPLSNHLDSFPFTN